MPLTATYTEARANLAKLWDRLEQDRDSLVIERRGHESMVMMPAGEVSSLMETAHLLRSPANARRLLQALHDSYEGRGEVWTIEALRKELGLE